MRFACRGRRKTADSTDAPGAVPFRHGLRLSPPAQRRSGLQGWLYFALASPWFALTFNRPVLARLVLDYVGCRHRFPGLNTGAGRHIVMQFIPRKPDNVGIV